jgi:hypothetical protein
MPPPSGEGGGGPNGTASHTTRTSNHYEAGKSKFNPRNRRRASWRLPVLDSGRSDPWWYPEPDERGYPAAAHHLIELGLTPAPHRDGLHLMWRRGGRSRQAAELIAQRWEVAS